MKLFGASEVTGVVLPHISIVFITSQNRACNGAPKRNGTKTRETGLIDCLVSGALRIQEQSHVNLDLNMTRLFGRKWIENISKRNECPCVSD